MNRNSICFGFFRFVSRNQTNFFSVCFSFSNLYRNNRNKPKKSQESKSLLGCPRTINSVRTKTNQNSTCFGCFWFVFFAKPNKIFSVCFGVLDRYWSNRNKQNLWYWELNGLYFNKFAVVLVVFCLFRLFRNTETPCFDIKAKQSKQTSCFG